MALLLRGQPSVQIRTLGALELPRFGIDSHKQLLLFLAYLAHQGERPRDHLTRVFFPHARDARNSLSRTLSRLRKLIPGSVHATSRTVSTPFSTDAKELLQPSITPIDVTRLYQGAFLATIIVGDNRPQLADWIRETRRDVGEHVAHIMCELDRTSSATQPVITQLTKHVPDSPHGETLVLTEGQIEPSTMTIRRKTTLSTLGQCEGHWCILNVKEGRGYETPEPQRTRDMIRTLGQINARAVGLQDQDQLIVLLTYLALEGPCTREQIARLFWPSSERRTNSLSSALSRLRKAAPGCIATTPETIATVVKVDANRLLDAAHQASHREVAEVYNGTFLFALRLPRIGLDLENWLCSNRERFGNYALRTALHLWTSEGDHEAAGNLAQAALEDANIHDLEAHEIIDLHRLLVKTGSASERIPRELARDRGIEITSTTAQHRPDPQIW